MASTFATTRNVAALISRTVADAAQTLQRTLGYFFKTMLDHAANTAAVHEDLANLYPASQKASNAVALLNSSGAVFHDTPMMVGIGSLLGAREMMR